MMPQGTSNRTRFRRTQNHASSKRRRQYRTSPRLEPTPTSLKKANSQPQPNFTKEKKVAAPSGSAHMEIHLTHHTAGRGKVSQCTSPCTSRESTPQKTPPKEDTVESVHPRSRSQCRMPTNFSESENADDRLTDMRPKLGERIFFNAIYIVGFGGPKFGQMLCRGVM